MSGCKFNTDQRRVIVAPMGGGVLLGAVVGKSGSRKLQITCPFFQVGPDHFSDVPVSVESRQ